MRRWENPENRAIRTNAEDETWRGLMWGVAQAVNALQAEQRVNDDPPTIERFAYSPNSYGSDGYFFLYFVPEPGQAPENEVIVFQRGQIGANPMVYLGQRFSDRKGQHGTSFKKATAAGILAAAIEHMRGIRVVRACDTARRAKLSNARSDAELALGFSIKDYMPHDHVLRRVAASYDRAGVLNLTMDVSRSGLTPSQVLRIKAILEEPTPLVLVVGDANTYSEDAKA